MQRLAARRRGGLVVGVAFALAITACSNSGDDSSSKTTAAASTSAAPSSSAAAPTTAAGASSSSAAAPTTAAAATTTTLDLTKNVPLKDVPGVSDTEIKFSSFGTNSNNPLGTCVLDCYDAGIKAYFAYRNSQGGIWGRKLVLAKELDDALSANQAKALEIVSSNDTFATFGAAQFPSGWADIAKAGIPFYVWGIWADQANHQPGIYGYGGTTCGGCTSRVAAFEAKVAGAHKVAALGYGISPNSKVCAQTAAKSIQQYSANIGGATVAYVNDSLQFGLPNGIGPEVTAMKNAGVDFIISCLDLNAMKTIAQELQRQGYRDKVRMFHPNTYDQDFVKQAGSLFEGDIVSPGFRPFEADPGESGLKAYLEWIAKQGAQVKELSMLGWINADEAYTALKLAGPEFSRKAVIDALNKDTAYSADGLVNPIDWSRQHDAPTEDDPLAHGYKQDCVALVQIKGGAFEVIGDKTKPWNCWPAGSKGWSDPVPTAFS